MRTHLWNIRFAMHASTALLLATAVTGCMTGQYTPLGKAASAEIEQLKASLYRVEYRANAFTSKEQLDRYLRRRCADLTLREGYDYFHLAGRSDVLERSCYTGQS